TGRSPDTERSRTGDRDRAGPGAAKSGTRRLPRRRTLRGWRGATGARAGASEWSHAIMTIEGEPAAFDTSVAHVARVYNYWLGGKDNFAADRAAGEQAIKAFPNIVLSARSNRAYLART